MTIHAFRIHDHHGNISDGLVEDLQNNLYISPLVDTSGKNCSFDDDAGYVWGWANELGFRVEYHRINLDLTNREATWENE